MHKTLSQRKQAHPRVNVLAFQANYNKSFGFGNNEVVCGYCLASHYFDEREPEFCAFCRAPIRRTQTIADLPEVVNEVFWLSAALRGEEPQTSLKLALVWSKTAKRPSSKRRATRPPALNASPRLS